MKINSIYRYKCECCGKPSKQEGWCVVCEEGLDRHEERVLSGLFHYEEDEDDKPICRTCGQEWETDVEACDHCIEASMSYEELYGVSNKDF